MKKKLDHVGKRLSYEWADRQREKRKKDLLWVWVLYKEGYNPGYTPNTWEQVELRLKQTMNRMKQRVMNYDRS